MGRVVSICNQKGGVGKTTTAINLGSSLASLGRKVLIIDLDSQANATSGLGIDKRSADASVYEVLLGQEPLASAVKSTAVNNLSIVPSKPALAGVEVELVGVEQREFRLREAVGSVRESFDFILIDTPPSLGLLTINSLAASDTVLIPLQCEYYAMEGLSQLLETVHLVQENLNPALKIEGILLTMADYRTKLTEQVIGEVRNFFGVKVFKTIVPRAIRLSEAPGFGKSITEYDPTSVGAVSYINLAKEVSDAKERFG